MRFLLAVSLTFLFSIASVCAETPGKVALAYLPFWSALDSSIIDKVKLDRSVYLDYAFIRPNEDGECALLNDEEDPSNDENYRQDQTTVLEKFRELKRKKPYLKTILSIGGWSNSSNFPSVASTEAKRKHFVSSCIALMEKYDFNGFDVDWEVPGLSAAGYNAATKDPVNHASLLKAFRAGISYHAKIKKRPESDFVLIASIGGGVPELKNWFRVDEFVNEVDFVNLMAHSFCNQLGCNPSALSEEEDGGGANAIDDVRYLEHMSYPDQKILLGLPFYGFAQKNINDQQTTETSYRDLKNKYLRRSKRWDQDFSPNSVWKTARNGLAFTYERKWHLAKKIDFVFTENLAGVSMWDLGQDTERLELTRFVRGQLDRFAP